MFPSRENKNGSGLDNQLLDGVSRSMDAFLDFLSGAAPAPLPGEDLPATGPETAPLGGSGIGLPNRSRCITDLPNGGCVIVNPPDIDDDRMEGRR